MESLSISKRDLWIYVNRKIKGKVKYLHVMAIVCILFEELIKDLVDGKVIDIHNFFELQLKKTNPRPYHDIRYGKSMMSKGSKILTIKLSHLVRKKIYSLIDMDKTFESPK